MDFTLSEEMMMVRDMVREFVQNELVPIERDVLVREKGGMRSAPIPREKYGRLKKLAVDQGLWAMSVPEAMGGGGLTALGACLVAEELGKSFVDFDFGDIPPILFASNAEQRVKFLQPLVSGEKECSLALREPGDENIKLWAEHGGEIWRLNGKKLAREADLYLVLAGTQAGLTCFMVERGQPGVHYQNGELILESVEIPAANLLGKAGGALELGKQQIDTRRVRSAARRLGIAARLLEMSSQYARDWKSLGQPLAVRPAVQRHLAEMAVDIDAARWLVYRAACEIDESRPAETEALRASLFASEMIRRAIDRTIQVYGGPAFAPDFPILRNYRSEGIAIRDEKILAVQRFQIANSLS